MSIAEADVLARVRAVQPATVVLTGIDLQQCAALPSLISRLREEGTELGLCSDGRGLTEELAIALQGAGLSRMHIPVHSARRDAQDWLTGIEGSLRDALKAIRTAVAAGLTVVAEVTLTRPTAPHLKETVDVLARVGVRTIQVRRLRERDTDPTLFVPLSPRLSLLNPWLEEAASAALGRRSRLVLRDLPVCVAPRLRRLFAAAGSEGFLAADGTEIPAVPVATTCATCPGLPVCSGAPADYVARFGFEELIDLDYEPLRINEDVARQQAEAASPPMVLGWDGPVRVQCADCGDRPDRRIEPGRAIRARLVQAARHRPTLLRLVGADLLAHPQAASLLYDALRLFPKVQVAAEAGSMGDWSEVDLRRLKDLDRIDFALYGPDAERHDAHCGIPGAFAAMRRAVERLRNECDLVAGSYAILHHVGELAAYEDAWARGILPGTPRFRLSGGGDSLDDLARCVRAMPPGEARLTLQSLLPVCLGGAEASAPSIYGSQRTIRCGNSIPYHPCGSDPLGAFHPCSPERAGCGAAGCVGFAVGWELGEVEHDG